jgi:hypothetical protein
MDCPVSSGIFDMELNRCCRVSYSIQIKIKRQAQALTLRIEIIMEPIGIIHTPYTTKEECPIQPLYASDCIGRVDVFGKFAEGLKDIETSGHKALYPEV